MKHLGTKEIRSNRITLRRFKKSDAFDMFNNFTNDIDVVKYLTWAPHKDIEVTRARIDFVLESYKNDNYYEWAIVLNENNQVIGSIAAMSPNDIIKQCEIGYCMSKEHWGKGIMTECLSNLIDYLINDVGFNRIQARHDIQNPASGKVMIKAGMKYEGLLRQSSKNNINGIYDCKIYSILKDDL